MGSRRLRWIGIVGLLALLVGARVAQSLATPSHAAAGMAQVAIVRTEGDVEAAVRQAVAQAGGLAGVVAPGDVVVIKPNLVMDAPASSGIVTDPAVTRAVVRLAGEAGASQVVIAEGTAQYRQGDVNRDRFCTQAAFRVAGYDADGDMIDDVSGALLVDLNDSGGTDVADPEKVTQVIVPTGLIRKEYWLPNVVLDADVLISVPVLKNHYNAGVTLGMKNLIGLLPNDLYHGPGNIYGKHSLSHNPVELDQHIVDVNLARRPDFVVVDGQRGMLDGPIGSQIIDPPMGLILAGRDVVAVDTIGALVMGYDPRAIPYLTLGAHSGLGTTDTSHIRTVGVELTQARRDFPAPYADSPAQRADAQPPTVAITAPSQEEWQGTVNVVVEAGDDDAVAGIALYLDDRWVGQAVASPYQFELDTEQHRQGTHSLRAIAYDRCLNRAESGREVRFGAPAATPTAIPSSTVTATPIPSITRPVPTVTPGEDATPLPTATSVLSTAALIPAVTPPPTGSRPVATRTSATTVEGTPPPSGSPPSALTGPGEASTSVPRPQASPLKSSDAGRSALDWLYWTPYTVFILVVAVGFGVLVGLVARKRNG
jgi:uncharacterized protein (DUF362 family)